MTKSRCLLAMLPLLVPIFSAGCSDRATNGASGPGDSRDGGTAADGSDNDSAIASERDPDADDGPLWDGRLKSEPKLIARNVSSSALTDDEAVVYATSSGVTSVVLESDARDTIATGNDFDVYYAGRAALAVGLDGEVLGWSKAAGVRGVSAMSGTNLGQYESLEAHPTASGDHVLIAQTNRSSDTDPAGLKRWLLDVTTLTATPMADGKGELVGCAAHGETIACVERINDSRSELSLFDASGTRARGAIPDGVFDKPVLVRDQLFVQGRGGIYRVAVDGNDPPLKLVSGVSAFIALQGGWIATMQGDGEIRVMHADGSKAKTVATGATLAMLDESFDTTRIRWVPICDRDGGKDSNLRVLDPASGRTVSLSKSCKLRGISYSDNFAFIIDNWVETPGDPILSGTGDPTIVDLRDGTKRGNPTGQDYFANGVIPLGKSRLLLRWLSFGQYSEGCFYDGHTNPSTPCAVFDGPIRQSAGYAIAKNGRGMLVHARNESESSTDLHHLTL